jgi:thiol-disulfide isomerase/thioredoxin
VTVLLVMATWCPDSKRELPRFFAIMDGVGLDDAVLTMVGVDRTKKDPEGLTETWGITRVPTFVFLRNGREVGRVVEKLPAGATLEGEIARILTPETGVMARVRGTCGPRGAGQDTVPNP